MVALLKSVKGWRTEETESQYVRVQIWRWGWDDGGDGAFSVVGVGIGVGRGLKSLFCVRLIMQLSFVYLFVCFIIIVVKTR